MRLFYFIFLLIINIPCIAQKTNGINFEKSASWMAIKQKAKKENKYIFLDAYTTWCIPCRRMAVNIFPQPNVGIFFNNNFINVSVQMDTTKGDDEQVKSWYRDAKVIADFYKIDAYPTYLIFNPDGNLVHRITGASDNAADFIATTKEAFNPKTQYINLKHEYKKGQRDSVFMLSFIKAAKDANDDSLYVYINTYLKTQSNLLTQQNIYFIILGTRQTSDIGFPILLNNPKQINAVIGESERKSILSTIVFNEQIYPLISYNGKIEHNGPMILYSQDSLRKNVNWKKMENEIGTNYKDASNRIFLYAKLQYYEWLNDWGKFNNCLLDYTANENELDSDFIDKNAWDFGTFCTNRKYFKDAIKWSDVLRKNDKAPYNLQTYSRLLYKSGDRELAIRYMEKCASLLKANDVSVNETIEKMKKGEEIE